MNEVIKDLKKIYIINEKIERLKEEIEKLKEDRKNKIEECKGNILKFDLDNKIRASVDISWGLKSIPYEYNDWRIKDIGCTNSISLISDKWNKKKGYYNGFSIFVSLNKTLEYFLEKLPIIKYEVFTKNR